jgi:hypothetical protein
LLCFLPATSSGCVNDFFTPHSLQAFWS